MKDSDFYKISSLLLANGKVRGSAQMIFNIYFSLSNILKGYQWKITWKLLVYFISYMKHIATVHVAESLLPFREVMKWHTPLLCTYPFFAANRVFTHQKPHTSAHIICLQPSSFSLRSKRLLKLCSCSHVKQN